MNSKLNLCSGIFNVILGAMLALDCIMLAIFAVVCLLLSFSPFFFAAIPAFLIFGALFVLAVIAATANIITGTGAIITSVKGGKISKVFSAISIAVDAVVLPAEVCMFAYSIFGFINETAPIFIIMMLFSFVAAGLCIAGIVLNIIRLIKDKPTV